MTNIEIEEETEMTIRDLAHLLLTAPDLDRDVKISTGGYKSHITRVEFIENGEF